MSKHVKGDDELKAKLHQVKNDLTGNPMKDAMREATLLVMRDAKINAPVDTGVLRASITPDVDVRGGRVLGIVGSNKVYAPYMEMGTGTFVGRPRHVPPIAALKVWASRHGVNAAVVAKAIARRGGLRPRRYLQDAFEKNQTAIKSLLERGVERIVDK